MCCGITQHIHHVVYSCSLPCRVIGNIMGNELMTSLGGVAHSSPTISANRVRRVVVFIYFLFVIVVVVLAIMMMMMMMTMVMMMMTTLVTAWQVPTQSQPRYNVHNQLVSSSQTILSLPVVVPRRATTTTATTTIIIITRIDETLFTLWFQWSWVSQQPPLLLLWSCLEQQHKPPPFVYKALVKDVPTWQRVMHSFKHCKKKVQPTRNVMNG